MDQRRKKTGDVIVLWPVGMCGLRAVRFNGDAVERSRESIDNPLMVNIYLHYCKKYHELFDYSQMFKI